MHINRPHVSIIILNWNGWKDTIECLESVLKSDYPNFNVVLVDNDSQDDSIYKILSWANGAELKSKRTVFPHIVFPPFPKPVKISEIKDFSQSQIKTQKNIKSYAAYKGTDIVLLRNSENSGFSSANNLAIKSGSILFNSKYYYLLNNDTVIEKNTLSSLVGEMENHKNPVVMTSAIYDYYHSEIIANLGGKINCWGNRKYYKKTSNQS